MGARFRCVPMFGRGCRDFDSRASCMRHLREITRPTARNVRAMVARGVTAGARFAAFPVSGYRQD